MQWWHCPLATLNNWHTTLWIYIFLQPQAVVEPLKRDCKLCILWFKNTFSIIMIIYKKEGCSLNTTEIYIYVKFDWKGQKLCILSLQNTKFFLCNGALAPWNTWGQPSGPPWMPHANTTLSAITVAQKSPHVENLPIKPICWGPWILSWPRALEKLNPALAMRL